MFTCNDCDQPYQSYGDCSGVCEGCRDERDRRSHVDAMDEDEWREYHAQQARQSNMLFRTLLNMKVA